MAKFTYQGSKSREISFPLGGIGSGCIGLAGNGRLIDWEIFNRPNKGSVNGLSHFAVKAEKNGKVEDARILVGPLNPPYNNGFGIPRNTMAGMPHFKDCVFHGEFPLAELIFKDKRFPGKVKMTAFNPFIPLNDKDSSIPAAFYEVSFENTTGSPLTYTVCLSVRNPFPNGNTLNRRYNEANHNLISLSSDKYAADASEYGEVAFASDAGDASYQEYWYREGWFYSLSTFWREFSAPGRLKNRVYEKPGQKNEEDHASIAAHLDVEPGKTAKARFVIAWHFPNCRNYWNPPEKCGCGKEYTWKNYYATLFPDAKSSAVYALTNWDRLYRDTLLFKETLFKSSLPQVCLEAVSANISILKTPTCLRLTDGSFYGFEGCGGDSGCCEGSCTHVWNYAYALPFLFPALERSMRTVDYRYNQREDGAMSFRLQLPLGRDRSTFRPCADGQFGGIIKAYRDWKISGNAEWLRSIWPALKKSLDFAWAKSNEDKWDTDKDGVLEGRQHHTLDMELFGPNSWLTGFYLAALKAAAEMAEFFHEAEKAAEYRKIFEKGKHWVDDNLFNGEYYHQKLDMKDSSLLQRFDAMNYWHEEEKEIKFQIAEGCGIDQILAQWHANLCGLGEIFDKKQARQALQAIYKYNYKKELGDFTNPCRLYAMEEESGTVVCDWPQGKNKPAIPVPYAEECWTGTEYQFASHLIQEGFVGEALAVVSAARARFDGEKRNPWNEFECGSNYARAMSSYALLLAWSGFEYDLTKGMIGFNPAQMKEDDFRCFWCLDPGWGELEIRPHEIMIKVLYGALRLNAVRLPFLADEKIRMARVDRRELRWQAENGKIVFPEPAVVNAGSILKIEISG
ncbi:MAG: GH116 family glycosyl-hydrolase [Bacillota bacterium]